MVEVKPINMYIPTKPRDVTTNPYDVIPDDELVKLRDNPLSFIHVILPEGNGEDRYSNARNVLQRMIQGVFRLEKDSMFLYEQSRSDFRQRGLVAGYSLKDYEEGRIKRHEKTREKPLRDRIKHIQATQAHTGLVWLTIRSNNNLKQLFDKVQEGEPLFDFIKYGWRNRVWKIPEEFVIPITEVVSQNDLYIADGHHRIASAHEYMKKMRGEGNGEGPWDYVLAYAANDDEVRILPYNRVIRRLPMPFDEFMEKVKERFDVVEGDPNPKKHEICMFAKEMGKWYKLRPKEVPGGSVDSLDVAILQNQLLSPILGINDPRKDPNIFFVGGELTVGDYEKYVKDGGNALIFSLYPTSVEEVEAVADASLDMPPKSTWFDPKLLSGLFVHPLWRV